MEKEIKDKIQNEMKKEFVSLGCVLTISVFLTIVCAVFWLVFQSKIALAFSIVLFLLSVYFILLARYIAKKILQKIKMEKHF